MQHKATATVERVLNLQQSSARTSLAPRPTLYPSKEGRLARERLDGCGGFQVRATSYPLTTRDQQGLQQADTPLLGYKVGFLSERCDLWAVTTQGSEWGARDREPGPRCCPRRHAQPETPISTTGS